MEPTKLKMSELKKMENGEIPITEQGKQQLAKLKEQLGFSPNFNAIVIAASQNLINPNLSTSILAKLGAGATSKSLIFPKPIIPAIFTNPEFLKSFAVQIESHKQAMRIATSSFAVGFDLVQFKNSQLQGIFNKIANDPELKRRFELMGEKEKLMRSVIEKWKAHLLWRIENRPFETFAHQFEYACYDLLDEVRNNDELAAIGETDFKCALQCVADKIVEEDNRKLEKWKNDRSEKYIISKDKHLFAQQKSLPTPTKPKPSANDEKPLSQRQRILKHFYEGGKMVPRQHNKYNKYITFSSSRKRLSYPNESQPKLKLLIADIEKVIIFLSDKAKQVAEYELNTLMLRLTIEK
ncbi:hypothetical protein GO730_26515 [Spirosoma sp. HMF3257]|uniref:Uncharacterized protein n=1 Tax=Spirosoma telluris TaxID=2183553 RepID=A0A327NVG6_9BACT|nr:hypothetical protein [Spirosoma telluris]RAI76828.1 hypothetical protein HMF3257_26445 [Spirosoma telluris]